jgi:hypothetical protein
MLSHPFSHSCWLLSTQPPFGRTDRPWVTKPRYRCTSCFLVLFLTQWISRNTSVSVRVADGTCSRATPIQDCSGRVPNHDNQLHTNTPRANGATGTGVHRRCLGSRSCSWRTNALCIRFPRSLRSSDCLAVPFIGSSRKAIWRPSLFAVDSGSVARLSTDTWMTSSGNTARGW